MHEPYAVYVVTNAPEGGRAVSVQWEDHGEYVTLHEDGSVTEQFREPKGRRITGRHSDTDSDETAVA